MLTSITIRGFRKFEELRVENLGDVNFLLGRNGVGKTSVLEGVFAWACGQDMHSLLNVLSARSGVSERRNPYRMMEEVRALVRCREKIPFRMSFSGVDSGEEVQFHHTIFPSVLPEPEASSPKGTRSGSPKAIQVPVVIARWEVERNGERVSENINVPSETVSKGNPFRVAKFMDLSSPAMSGVGQICVALKREKLLETVSEEIRRVFPEAGDFDVDCPDNPQMPVGIRRKDGCFLPLHVCGEGIQRGFCILGTVALSRNAILCVDGVDTGLHPDVFMEFCRRLSGYAGDNHVQLFMTTHNMEFVDHYLNATAKPGCTVSAGTRVITLRDIDGTVARTLSGEEAERLRTEYRMELR
ncbi:MAG: AAA family ATPase [Clostridia bacterium]|nr:AAA family ATPase [Clostridia bacterium]